MNAAPRLILAFLALALVAPARAADNSAAIAAIASPDPAKIAMLKGERAANDRLHKIVAWMEEARTPTGF